MDKASALCKAQRWLRDLSMEEVEKMLQAKRQELAAAGQKKLASAVLVQQRMSVLDTVAAQFHLQDLARGSQDKPFANPYWWGAFQCVGAGWKPKGDSLEA